MIKILVVEDDKDLNRAVCSFLLENGYDANGVFSGEEAIDKIFEVGYDLILSDIMMPELDGYGLARAIRKDNPELPIIFMTARDDIISKERGYRIGIDDWITKPVNLDELLLRIGALLRRSHISQSKRIELGYFVMDTDEYIAYFKGEEIALTKREFKILFKLLSYPKKTFTRQALMDEFWPYDSSSGTRTVDVYMTKLRAKLAICDEFEIQTVHGLGYRAVINEKK